MSTRGGAASDDQQAAAEPSESRSPAARLGLIGLSGGLLAGLFGVGGGVVMVPLFAGLVGLPQKRASSTSLLAIVPIATAAAWGYARQGNIDFGAGAALLLGGVVGGQLGGWLLPRVPGRALQIAFGVLTILTAVRLLWPTGGAGQGAIGGSAEAAALVLVGLAAGVLAALLGVGGGIILVPALVLLAGASADVARGTSLVVVIGTALTASARLQREGLVDVRAATWAGLVGAPAGLLGAALGQWLPQRAALLLFAALLVYSGGRLVGKGLASPNR